VIRLVALDMDGTLVDVESSWHAVHEYFGESNEEALDLFIHDRIDDEEFLKRDLAIWRRHRPNLQVDELERILASVPLMPGAVELLNGLRERGVHSAIISGGIDVLARRIGRELGIDYVLANGFRVDADGKLTGEGIIRVPIKNKEAVLAQVQAQLGVPVAETAAVGNSEIDVGMFRRSRIGIAFAAVDAAVRAGATHVVAGRDLRKVLEVLEPELPAVRRVAVVDPGEVRRPRSEPGVPHGSGPPATD
jgi:phosphoserine phosphatase